MPHRGRGLHHILAAISAYTPPYQFSILTRQAMSSHLADNADHWRKRAEELRRLAEIMSRVKPKEMVLRLAVDYDRLALHAEERANESEGRAQVRH
jgi:hypothetical protein